MGTIADKTSYLYDTKHILGENLKKLDFTILEAPVIKENLVIEGLLNQEGNPTPDNPVEINCKKGSIDYNYNISKNIFDYNINWEYDSETNEKTSDHFEIKPSTQYTISGRVANAEHNGTITFLDADEEEISTIVLTQDQIPYTFMTPGNCAYAKLTIGENFNNFIQIQEGSEATEYEYVKPSLSSYVDLGINIFDINNYETLENATFGSHTVPQSKNYIDSDGYWSDWGDGYQNHAPDIRLANSTEYTISGTISTANLGGYIKIYDENWESTTLNFSPNQTSYTFTTPENYEALKVYIPSDISPIQVQIELGSTATEYEPYKEPLWVTEIVEEEGKSLYYISCEPNTEYHAGTGSAKNGSGRMSSSKVIPKIGVEVSTVSGWDIDDGANPFSAYVKTDKDTQYLIFDCEDVNKLMVSSVWGRLYDFGDVPYYQYAKNIIQLYSLNNCTDRVIKALGKNLLNSSLTSTTLNNLNILKRTDGTVCIDGTASANTEIYLVNSSDNISLKEGSYLLNGCPDNNYKIEISIDNNIYQDTGNGIIFTIDNETTISYIKIIINQGQTLNNVLFKPMLIKSDISTDYEPFGWIKDKWYLHQNTGVVTLYSTDEITLKNANTSNAYFEISSKNIDALKVDEVKSNYLTQALITDNNTTEGFCIDKNTGNIKIRYFFDGEISVEKFEEFLENNKIIIYYTLKNPIIEEISENKYPALANSVKNIEGLMETPFRNYADQTQEFVEKNFYEYTFYQDSDWDNRIYGNLIVQKGVPTPTNPIDIEIIPRVIEFSNGEYWNKYIANENEKTLEKNDLHISYGDNHIGPIWVDGTASADTYTLTTEEAIENHLVMTSLGCEALFRYTYSGGSSATSRVLGQLINKNTDEIIASLDLSENRSGGIYIPMLPDEFYVRIFIPQGTTCDFSYTFWVTDIEGKNQYILTPYREYPYTFYLDLDNFYRFPIELINDYYESYGGWRGDYLSGENLSYITKRVEKVIFDGSEDWSINSENNYFSIDFWNATNPILCSHFQNLTGENFDNANCGISAGYDCIKIKHPNCSTVEEFKQWLSNNHITVYIYLEMSKDDEIEITDEAILNDLKMIKETYVKQKLENLSNYSITVI